MAPGSHCYPDAVLVTGAHRSGTTWVGRMLCASGELGYIHEPFNSNNWPRLLGTRLDVDYLYVTRENEDPYLAPVADLLALRPPLLRQLAEARAPRAAARLLRTALQIARWRVRRRSPLVKDPIALFAAPWLAERFATRVVVTIRHPAAYASSVVRLGWSYNFEYMLRQPLLMRDLLGPWRQQIRSMARAQASPLEQAILLWRILYGVVDRFRDEHPDWTFVRHEDLASDPSGGFAALYERLGLTLTAKARSTIESHTREGNPAERPTSERHNIRRDSRAARFVWTSRLRADEIARIRDGVGDIGERFYSDADWTRPTGSGDRVDPSQDPPRSAPSPEPRRG